MGIIEMWWLSVAIFAVVIVVVAVLLSLIIAAAKQIDYHASEIWKVGKQIAGNTVSIWMLDQTNRRLNAIAATLGGVERHARDIGKEPEGPDRR